MAVSGTLTSSTKIGAPYTVPGANTAFTVSVGQSAVGGASSLPVPVRLMRSLDGAATWAPVLPPSSTAPLIPNQIGQAISFDVTDPLATAQYCFIPVGPIPAGLSIPYTFAP